MLGGHVDFGKHQKNRKSSAKQKEKPIQGFKSKKRPVCIVYAIKKQQQGASVGH